MFLLVNGEALDAVLELEEEVVCGKYEVQSIMVHLDKLYKKDDTLSTFHALESFETYKQPSTRSILEYINEFEKCPHKVKNYGAEMPDNILAYCLLKNANFKQSKLQLMKYYQLPSLRSHKEKLKKYSVTCHLPVPTRFPNRGGHSENRRNKST